MNSQIQIDDLRQWFKPKSRRAILGLMIVMVAIVVLQAMNQSPRKVMCDLMDGYSIRTSEKRRILLALGSAGLNDFEFEGDRILVPKIDRAKYLNAVAEQNALPAMLAATADEDLKLNPFMPRSQQRLLENSRKKRQIREMVMQLPFVAEAWFEMDWAESNRVFQPDRNSAVIMIQPAENQSLNRQQVATIKGLISGAIADLKPAEIVVTDVSVGIAYQDLNDVHQSQLIDLVNWRIHRQRHYRDQIESVLAEYDGIEIEVRIFAGNKPKPPGNQVAGKSVADGKPRRLPKPLARTDEHDQQPRVGANSVASVSNDHRRSTVHVASQAAYIESELDDSPAESRQHDTEANIAQLPSFRREVDVKQLPDPVSEQPEVVNVLVRVPGSTITKIVANMSTNPEPVSRQKVIEQIKADIISRIRPLLPAASFADCFPISVVFATESTPAPIPGLNGSVFNSAIVKYWPLLAVVLVGLLAMLWTRSREKTVGQPIPLVEPTPSKESDAEVIRSQLSNLIDQDPATAAKVIKNWIRQAG